MAATSPRNEGTWTIVDVDGNEYEITGKLGYDTWLTVMGPNGPLFTAPRENVLSVMLKVPDDST